MESNKSLFNKVTNRSFIITAWARDRQNTHSVPYPLRNKVRKPRDVGWHVVLVLEFEVVYSVVYSKWSKTM